MKQILVMMAAVVLVGCSKDAPTPDPPVEKKIIVIADPIVEKAIRFELDKPAGEFTEEDLAKVTFLSLWDTQITDEGLKDVTKLQKLEKLNLLNTQITDAGLKEVAKLQNLEELDLSGTQVTDGGGAELKKALPNCWIDGP